MLPCMDANLEFLREDDDIKQSLSGIWKKHPSCLFVLEVKIEHLYQTGRMALLDIII